MRKKNEKAIYPLLLTGTIDSGVYNNIGNQIQNVDERKQQYEEAIRAYIEETVFNPIIFIENSGYLFEEERFQQLAHENGKQFEFIQGTVTVDEVLKRGKSYGDAFLIHEALQKSKCLGGCSFFYKITGRIFLKNASSIVKTCSKYRNEFIVYENLGWCLTNIFKANKDDYLRVLDDVYLDCDEKTKNDIEIVFYKRLASANITVGSFETYPYFSGIQGATLRAYSGNAVERTIRTIMAKMHVFTMKSPFRFILSIIATLKGIKPYK